MYKVPGGGLLIGDYDFFFRGKKVAKEGEEGAKISLEIGLSRYLVSFDRFLIGRPRK